MLVNINRCFHARDIFHANINSFSFFVFQKWCVSKTLHGIFITRMTRHALATWLVRELRPIVTFLE